MIFDDLKKRSIPDVLTFANGNVVDNPSQWSERRAEILEILSTNVYGFSPPPPKKVSAEVELVDNKYCAGKAVHKLVHINFNTPKGEFSFPVNIITPVNVSPVPLFLHIAFRPNIPDKYMPVEEIIDSGFAIASFCYQDVTPDADDDFVAGLPVMYAGSRRNPDNWGKISMWAWAASRVMDYLQTVDEVDSKRIAVVGHSRLGKTALWCAAQDERFIMAISNNSGCSGAAITRGKKGEQIKNITSRFGYWFCENYLSFANNEEKLPLDQHFLLAAIAPRFVYVSSAMLDEWADPKSEFLSCVATNSVYELLGLEGLVTTAEYAKPGTSLHNGRIGYHMREGTHYLSRYDWQQFMNYFKKKI